MIDPDDLQPPDQGRFGATPIGDQDSERTRAASEGCHGKRASDGADRTIKSQFSAHDPTFDTPPTVTFGRDRPGTGEGRDRDRQVVHRPFLAAIGRGQIHGQTTPWPVESCISNGRANSFRRLSHRGVGQTHDAHRRQPVRRKIDFDATGFGRGADEYETAGAMYHATRLDR